MLKLPYSELILRQISVRRNIRTVKFPTARFPYGKVSFGRNFLTEKFPYGEISDGEIPVTAHMHLWSEHAFIERMVVSTCSRLPVIISGKNDIVIFY